MLVAITLLLATDIALVAMLRHCCRGGEAHPAKHGRRTWWRNPQLLLNIPLRLDTFLCSFIFSTTAFFAWQVSLKVEAASQLMVHAPFLACRLPTWPSPHFAGGAFCVAVGVQLAAGCLNRSPQTPPLASFCGGTAHRPAVPARLLSQFGTASCFFKPPDADSWDFWCACLDAVHYPCAWLLAHLCKIPRRSWLACYLEL